MSLVHTNPTVDVNIPRFNQTVVAVLVAVAFVADASWLVALTALMLALPLVFGEKANLTARIYVAFIRDLADAGGPSEVEDAKPPRFAALLGAVFTTAAAVALLSGWAVVGWVLAGLVGGLALLAATSRICVGCIIYQRAVR